MMRYNNYNAEDFLTDEFFLQYCTGSNESAITFWQDELKKEPGIAERFNEAVNLFHVLNGSQGNLKEQTDRLKKRISNSEEVIKPAKHFPIYRWLSVAAVVVIFAAGSYFYFARSGKTTLAKTNNSIQLKNDVAPGGNKAVLTLSNGTKIILDSANNGALTQQGNTKIIKLDNGKLSYSPSKDGGEVLYNTITTPRGGQYQIVLADGSKVWLNAASSLRFPASFNGKERNVELTGEGYFEVAKNAEMPFKVKVNDMEVTVLGTHFNINSYADEAVIKTTLLEGSVKVIKGNNTSIIKPGQQASVNNSEENIKTVTVDVDHEVAWKDGLFDFDNDNIKDIMHQLARWYDVDIKYSGEITSKHYTGSIRRQVNISQVLHMLNLAGGIEFQIEENKITVKEK